MPQLDIIDLKAAYDHTVVLKDINLQLEKGEIVSLIGPSGSGKSTLLRVLIGLLPPAQGRVHLDGEHIDYSDKQSLRSLRERHGDRVSAIQFISEHERTAKCHRHPN